MKIRNLAIIAHVDHGKTTLIDGLFRNAGLFSGHHKAEERVMDSGELEKERGITIRSKNASFDWKETRINIVDTPGHADFGGEVERALHMVDGALLLVDAAEGPLPQTRFVLKKALERGLKIICVINKVDRPDARIEVVEEKLLELFYDVAAHEDQTHYNTIYASAKEGWASLDREKKTENFAELLDQILEDIPDPKLDPQAPFKMLVTNLGYSSFVGPIAIGRIESGSVTFSEQVLLLGKDGLKQPFKVTSLESFSGLGTSQFEKLEAGSVVLIAGASDPQIGDTIAGVDDPTPLPRIEVDPPTVTVRVSINTSPFAGKEGNYATSRKLYELLEGACLENVALKLQATESSDVFLLKARGELAIVILMEELRRQGWEFMVGRPEILPVEIDGKLMEPEEIFVVDIPEDMIGVVTSLVSERGARMVKVESLEGSHRKRLEFEIPGRGLIGIRSDLLTQTRGEAIYSSSFNKFIPYKGKRLSRKNGALVSDRAGDTTEYALYNLQARGRLFIGSGVKTYEGMIFGESSKINDMNCNPNLPKKLSNMRAAAKDESTRLKGFTPLELEESLEWIDEDEWVEITPKNVRVRKQVLQANQRKVQRG